MSFQYDFIILLFLFTIIIFYRRCTGARLSIYATS